MMKLLVIISLLFLGACVLFGQTGVTPPPGDPMVFYMFLRHHDALAKDARALAATGTASTRDAEMGAAVSMHVGVDDFVRIGETYQQLEPALAAIDAKANAYRDAVTSGATALDVAVIRSFSASRNQAILRARAQLQGALAPEAWQALSAYIDGEYRQSVRVAGGAR
jgi:hypothetical protein